MWRQRKEDDDDGNDDDEDDNESKLLKFADDTKIFRDVSSSAGRGKLQHDRPEMCNRLAREVA